MLSPGLTGVPDELRFARVVELSNVIFGSGEEALSEDTHSLLR
jgi:hypothetical protein